jgi:hypothetical protein
MSQENVEIGEQEPWWVMGKSLAFVFGVPIGIAVGVIVGAVLEIVGVPHSGPVGLLSGFDIPGRGKLANPLDESSS